MKTEEEIKLKINELENEAMLCLDGNSTGDDIRLEINLALWELANWLLETKPKPKTKVKFLIDYEPIDINTPKGNVFAFFPEVKDGIESYLCYSRIGQHSSCSSSYVERCTLATVRQYQVLYNELISIGYDLEILN